MLRIAEYTIGQLTQSFMNASDRDSLRESVSPHFIALLLTDWPDSPERKYKLRRAYHVLLFLSKGFCYCRSRKGRRF
jgi:hypothetical protein